MAPSRSLTRLFCFILIASAQCGRAQSYTSGGLAATLVNAVKQLFMQTAGNGNDVSEGGNLRHRTELVQKLPQPNRCISCTSVDASQIVGGAGVHPGVYLTSILLSTIPITPKCKDPFVLAETHIHGIGSPMCEEGLCVKINYTDKFTGNNDVLRACLPRSEGVFKQVCTGFASGQAHGTWCVCEGDLCNGATPTASSKVFSSVLLIFIGALCLFFGRNI